MRSLSALVGVGAIFLASSAFASEELSGRPFGDAMLCRPTADLLDISFDDDEMRLGSISLREGTLPMETATVVHLAASAVSKTDDVSFASIELVAIAGEDIAFALSARPVLTKVAPGETVLLQDWIVSAPGALAAVTAVCVRASKLVEPLAG